MIAMLEDCFRDTHSRMPKIRITRCLLRGGERTFAILPNPLLKQFFFCFYTFTSSNFSFLHERLLFLVPYSAGRGDTLFFSSVLYIRGQRIKNTVYSLFLYSSKIRRTQHIKCSLLEKGSVESESLRHI